MNRKGNPKISEYGKDTRFGTERGCNPVEAGRKGNEAQAATRELMRAVADKIDIGKASDKLAEMVAKGDINAWKLWLEYTASKPATKVEMDNKMVFTFGEDDDTGDTE